MTLKLSNLKARGHLRPTTCIRKHQSRTFASDYLRLETSVPDIWVPCICVRIFTFASGHFTSFRTQMSGTQMSETKVSGRKCSDSTIRTEKSGTQISERKWPLAKIIPQKLQSVSPAVKERHHRSNKSSVPPVRQKILQEPVFDVGITTLPIKIYTRTYIVKTNSTFNISRFHFFALVFFTRV